MDNNNAPVKIKLKSLLFPSFLSYKRSFFTGALKCSLHIAQLQVLRSQKL